MSWILGYVGTSLSRSMRERLAAFTDDRLFQRVGKTYYVAGGGLETTCRHGELPDQAAHWAVVGTGVRLEDEACGLLTAADWKRRLEARRPRLDRLGGGFLAFRWSTRHVEAFSDCFGLRSLYWMAAENGHMFSTRPDWLASLRGGLTPDWTALGSHWLTYNQLSWRALANGLNRLGPGGHVDLTPESASATQSPYTPAPFEADPAYVLRSLTHPSDRRTLSLGLSGGLDSRTLLAAARGHQPLAVHIFGPRSRSDGRVALRVADEEDLSFVHLHDRPPAADELLNLIRTHAAQSHAVSPASAALTLRYYPALHAHHKLVIDGGFGEIMRRQFMNRLLRNGRPALEARNPEAILPHISFTRAEIFHEDIRRELLRGALDDIDEIIDRLTARTQLDLADQIDLLNVWTRLPNFFGYEQARLDGLVQNYMPFAHPRLIDAVFAVPSVRRARGRLARQFIQKRAPELQRYPLVKSDVAYPYWLPATAAALYVKAYKKLTPARQPEDRAYVLQALKSYILDRVRSSEVINGDAYDAASLQQLADRYYETGEGAGVLDWWLAFDFWRASLQGS